MGLTKRLPEGSAVGAQSDASGDENTAFMRGRDEEGGLLSPSGKSKGRSALGYTALTLVMAVTAVCGVVAFFAHGVKREWGASNVLNIVTWNIAAINNNPFEYWITHNDADYNKLMADVESFISAPGARDVLVEQVFTPAMWVELKAEMRERGWAGLEEVEAIWSQDYSKRSIIAGFLKDHSLGEKRLASMPDRITNTIRTADAAGVAYRPTVINCFSGEMGTLPAWWAAWKRFMFHEPLALPGASDKAKGPVWLGAAGLLQKIKRSKYPAVSEREENISIPLQTLAQAIFDAVLVHMVGAVSPGAKWQGLRKQMCDALNRKKDERTLEILGTTYADASLVFLQETAAAFTHKAVASELGSRFHIVSAATPESKRDQNSAVMLRKSFFRVATVRDHTAAASAAFDKSVPVAEGDLLVISVEDTLGRKYLLASFHGDTNGLATAPVLAAVDTLAKTMPTHKLVFGLDANVHAVAVPHKKAGVMQFAADYVARGYTSCWGDSPDPLLATTYNARTYLQPQLQKAAGSAEKASKGDRNPKDFILFPSGAFTVLTTSKDNTGQRKCVHTWPRASPSRRP